MIEFSNIQSFVMKIPIRFLTHVKSYFSFSSFVETARKKFLFQRRCMDFSENRNSFHLTAFQSSNKVVHLDFQCDPINSAPTATKLFWSPGANNKTDRNSVWSRVGWYITTINKNKIAPNAVMAKFYWNWD